MPQRYILTTHGLMAGYGKRSVIGPADLQLHRGSLTVLVGSNGIGKSTLLRTLSGAQKAIAGTVSLSGRDLSDYSLNEIARQMSVVYTDRTSAGALSVWETVALGRQPHTGIFGHLSSEDKRIINESLDILGIGTMRDRLLATLSDGERQKTMIARALAQATPLIILDEPTSFLDAASRIEIMQFLRQLCDKHSKSILLSTHDIGPALDVADYLWVVDRNTRHIECGARDNIIATGIMDRVFDSRNVRFDATTGDYRFSQPT